MTSIRAIGRTIAIGAATLFALAAGAFLALWLAFAPSKDEVARVTSPHAPIDAVVVETNGGATTPFGYEVHVVDLGAPANGPRAALIVGASRSHDAHGVNLRWSSQRELVVEFMSADSAALERTSFTVAGQIITISLREGVSDSHAPAGGMLYNLRSSRP